MTLRFKLRTLLIVLALGPPVLWAGYRIGKPAIIQEWRQWTRQGPPGWKDDGGEIYYYTPDDYK